MVNREYVPLDVKHAIDKLNNYAIDVLISVVMIR